MKKTFIAISLALFSCLILAACTVNATSTQEIPSNSGKNQPVSTNIGQDTSDVIADETCLPGGPSDTQLEYWEIDEFEDWMEQQRDQIQKLADNKDKSFYYKDDNGSYVCREWTQEDVDSLYEGWQDQLALMKDKNGKIIVNVITISIRLIQNWYLFVFFEFVIMDSPPKTMLCLYLHV